MKIDKMINNLIMLISLYRLHAKKLFNKIQDNDAKMLLLMSFKDNDILNILEDIVDRKKIFDEYIRNNQIKKAYMVYKDIEYKYKLAESLLYNKIEDLVKIRALDIAKSKKN